MNNGEIAAKIGAKVKQYRENLKIQQEEMAGKLGISRSSLSLIESGKQEPNLDTLAKIAQITKLDLREIFNMNAKRIVIIDTSVILNRPKYLDIVVKYADTVVIPETVIREINYQKDHGDPQHRKNASLCESEIVEHKAALHIDPDETGEQHDDRIFSVVLRYAKHSPQDEIYLLSNDKDFRLKNTGSLLNLHVVTPQEFDTEFIPKQYYDVARSQRFFTLVKSRNVNEARDLADGYQVNVNAIDGYTGFTPLIQAVRNQDSKMVEYLLTISTIDVNAVDEKKYMFPPISHAVQMNNPALVTQLLNGGANVNAPAKNQRNYFNTPLMIAAWGGNLKIVQILVEAGACVNQQDKGNGFTALIKAVFQNQPDIVQCLLKHGADKSISSFEGKTALDYAYEKNDGNRYAEIIAMLK